jgi:cytochrome b
MASVAAESKKISVWDPIVRIGHWVLVAAFFVAYFTEDDLLRAHVWAGYTVGAVVILRIVWGFVGSRNARFSSFLYGPAAGLKYLIGLVRGGMRRHVGHSPAGAFMIFLLLASLAATVGSGLTVYAYDSHAGPLATFVGVSNAARAGGNENGSGAESEAPGGAEAREETWEELHEVLANFTLALVGLHILGVLVASFVYRENLVAAMITGKKRGEDERG